MLLKIDQTVNGFLESGVFFAEEGDSEVENELCGDLRVDRQFFFLNHLLIDLAL
jgi:hypothetical protein